MLDSIGRVIKSLSCIIEKYANLPQLINLHIPSMTLDVIENSYVGSDKLFRLGNLVFSSHANHDFLSSILHPLLCHNVDCNVATQKSPWTVYMHSSQICRDWANLLENPLRFVDLSVSWTYIHNLLVKVCGCYLVCVSCSPIPLN